jgi:hypothetical protein
MGVKCATLSEMSAARHPRISGTALPSTPVVCRQCDQSFGNEAGLGIHVGRMHRTATSVARLRPRRSEKRHLPTDFVDLDGECAEVSQCSVLLLTFTKEIDWVMAVRL